MQVVKLLVLLLAVGAVCCVMIAALTPVSRAKALRRLAGSLFIGTAFPLGALSQAVEQRTPIPAVVGMIGGAFLVWIGFRKYRRDPRRANASCPDSLARRPDELGNFLASISQSPVTHSRSPFQFYAGGHPASIHGFLNQSCREVHHVRNHSGSGRPLIPIP